ncbi:TetR/AcrR family transcriptional regulator [Streptomyces sp. NBC_01465]|uniref:TetR/AcrR family transcriptional regulator n=1 Tax=Streptomyces sp. NBC_01465 TaxID=2903878 RepID=UPI002E2F6E81|nr:TetR/AcrR family transcriptional regulator [Streptomyces sp. NBC_01465]
MAGRQKKDGDGDGDGAEPSLWERLDRPAPAARTSLTPQKIAEVAVAIADAEGFAAVTMRRLAKELDVAPMAAYRHVSGKDDLWALMVDRIFAELGAASKATGWREVLRAEALNVRELMLRHPWMGELPAPLFVLTPNRMATAERQFAALDGRGLDVDTMMVALRTVNAYVYGTTRSEVALQSYMKQRGWDGPDQTRTALAPQMNYLMETGRYPAYRRYIHEASHKDDPSWEFELGLDCVLDGIEARLGLA